MKSVAVKANHVMEIMHATLTMGEDLSTPVVCPLVQFRTWSGCKLDVSFGGAVHWRPRWHASMSLAYATGADCLVKSFLNFLELLTDGECI